MHHRSVSPREQASVVCTSSAPVVPCSPGVRAKLRGWVLCAAIAATPALGLGADSDCVFVRGNIVNLESPDAPVVVDLNDAVDLVAYLLIGRSLPISGCLEAADADDDGLVTMADYTYLVNFLFGGGPPPPPPYPEPGTDPTPETTVPDERDDRFTFAIGTATGVPNNTGLSVPITITNSAEIYGLTMVITYDPDQIRIDEIVTEEGTLLASQSADYITAEAHNRDGVAYISTLKDFATPFWFQSGEDPNLPAGTDQLVATLKCTIVVSANEGFASIQFTDGIVIPNGIVPPDELHLYPEVNNLVFEGVKPIRPVLSAESEGGITIRRGFIRGDANKDDLVDISDTIFLLSYIFMGTAAPPCMDAADANNDTRLDISDPIWMLNYLFQGGPQPSEPFPQPGVDPSDDGSGSLGCASD